MKKEPQFDWNEFCKLGNSYIEDENPAKQRTGISRFYYCAFCSSRDLINEKETYINENSKKIMTGEKRGNVHEETRKIFKKHPAYKDDKKGRMISRNLNKLRKMRNEADYDKTTTKPLPQMLENSKSRSKYILELLKEFSWKIRKIDG